MNKLISLILAVTILVLSFKDALLVVSFQLNQTAITDQWCVNIAEPTLMCAGSCYLTQKLIDQYQGPFNTLQNYLKNSFESDYLDLAKGLSFAIPESIFSSTIFKVLPSPSRLGILEIFHPPQF